MSRRLICLSAGLLVAAVGVGAPLTEDGVRQAVLDLESRNEHIRMRGVIRLRGYSEYAEIFVDLLDDPHPAMRRRALQALAMTKDPMYLPDLVRMLADESRMVRRSAVVPIASMAGRDAERHLVPLLKDPVASIRGSVLTQLIRIECPDVKTYARQMLNDESDRVRYQAHRIAGLLGPDGHAPPRPDGSRPAPKLPPKPVSTGLKAVDTLAADLSHRDPELRRWAVFFVSMIAERCVSRLYEAWEVETEVELRNDIAEQLEKLARRPDGVAVPISLTTREQIRTLSGRDGRKAAASIAEFLLHDDRDVRVEAVHALAKLHAVEHFDEIAAHLDDADRYVRSAVVEAVRELDHPQRVPTLVAALRNSNGAVQQRAMRALRELNAPSAADDIAAALDTMTDHTRAIAIQVLASLAGPEHWPVIAARIHDDNRMVAQQAIKAIRESGHPRSREWLETGIFAPTSGAR